MNPLASAYASSSSSEDEAECLPKSKGLLQVVAGYSDEDSDGPANRNDNLIETGALPDSTADQGSGKARVAGDDSLVNEFSRAETRAREIALSMGFLHETVAEVSVPRPVDGQVPEIVQAGFNRYATQKKEGSDFVQDQLRSKRDFHNPSILKRFVEFKGIQSDASFLNFDDDNAVNQ